MGNSVPKNLECQLALSTNTSTYDQFPIFVNGQSNMDNAKKKADEQTSKDTSPPDGREAFTLGGNLKNKDEDKEKKLEGARNNAKQISNYKYKKIYEEGEGDDKRSTSVSMTDTKLKFEDWVINEMEDIFAVAPLRIGWYASGGAKISVKMPLLDLVKPFNDEPRRGKSNGPRAWLLPLRGATVKMAPLPRAMPWAMCFWPYRPFTYRDPKMIKNTTRRFAVGEVPLRCRQSAVSSLAKCRFVVGETPLRHWQSAASLLAKRRFVVGETTLRCRRSGALYLFRHIA